MFHQIFDFLGEAILGTIFGVKNADLCSKSQFWVALRISWGPEIRSGSAARPARACRHGFRHSLVPYLPILRCTSPHITFSSGHLLRWVYLQVTL